MTVQSFIPRRSIATFKQTMFGGYLTATAQPYGFFSLQPSAFYQPYANTTNVIGLGGANKSNITLTPGFNTNQSPIGYSLMDVMYVYYKVRRGRMTARVLPISDVLLVSLEANGNQQSVVQQNSLGSNPYSKTVVAGPNQKPAEVTIDISSPTVLGYSATQWEGLSPTLMGTGPSSPQQWFFNFQWQNFTNGNPGGNIAFEFELTLEVELTEPENFTS